MPNPEWIGELNHPQLSTDEAKQALGKYGSTEEALVGGLNAMKAVGKPYKLPESLDKLPDDNVRTEFTGHINKLYGGIDSADAVGDVNFAEGLPEGSEVVGPLKDAFTNFAVEKKMTKSLFKDLVKFNNEFIGSDTFQQYMSEKQEKLRQQKAEEVNGKLTEALGSKEALQTGSENVKKMFQNNAGLNAEEFESVADDLIDSGITQNATLAKALINIANTFKEGSTAGQEPPPGETKSTIKDEMPGSAGVLGW